MTPHASPCDALLDHLAAGSVLPSSLAAHALDCPDCAPLLRADAALATLPGPAPALGPALRDALDALGPVSRPRPLTRALPGLLAAGATMAAIPALLGTSQRLGAWPLWAGAGLLATLCGVGLVLVFHRGAEGLGLPASWRRGYATVSALGLSAAVWMAPPGAPTAARYAASPSLEGAGTGAFRTVPSPALVGSGPATDPLSVFGEHASAGVLFAAVVGALVLRGAQRTTPVVPRLSGANAGIVAGLAAATGLHLSLDGSIPLRLCVLALPVVLGMLAGSLVGKRALAP